MPETKTEIAIGATDGFRYIAVRPPLSDGEVDMLANHGLIRQGSEEQVTLGPECTVLRGGWDTERAQVAAKTIADTLRRYRGNVFTDLTPVTLMGYQSSPFNPVTR